MTYYQIGFDTNGLKCRLNLTLTYISKKIQDTRTAAIRTSKVIYWYNNLEIHDPLDYISPIEYKESNAIKLRKAS